MKKTKFFAAMVAIVMSMTAIGYFAPAEACPWGVCPGQGCCQKRPQ